MVSDERGGEGDASVLQSNMIAIARDKSLYSKKVSNGCLVVCLLLRRLLIRLLSRNEYDFFFFSSSPSPDGNGDHTPKAAKASTSRRACPGGRRFNFWWVPPSHDGPWISPAIFWLLSWALQPQPLQNTNATSSITATSFHIPPPLTTTTTTTQTRTLSSTLHISNSSRNIPETLTKTPQSVSQPSTNS